MQVVQSVIFGSPALVDPYGGPAKTAELQFNLAWAVRIRDPDIERIELPAVEMNPFSFGRAGRVRAGDPWTNTGSGGQGRQEGDRVFVALAAEGADHSLRVGPQRAARDRSRNPPSWAGRLLSLEAQQNCPRPTTSDGAVD